jgi:hypothetical protein
MALAEAPRVTTAPPAELLARLEADPELGPEDRAWWRVTLAPSIERAAAARAALAAAS